MSNPKRVRIDKKDIYRALLTDTAPGDVPIVFSNDGFYDVMANLVETNDEITQLIVSNVLNSKQNSFIPFKYKIKKGELSFRTLSLVHPSGQKMYCDFYWKHASSITYYCSKSLLSIRAPNKVASSFYLRELDISDKYKNSTVDTTPNELLKKYSSSYFAYSGYDRLYKFFVSNKYLLLERTFTRMSMLDISNCFDSIYTHAINWSVKGKDHAKAHIKYKNQFASEFDALIQSSNNMETNGIPIGSEFSRIFAEILFHSIDNNVVKILQSQHGLTHTKDFEILRYVDDYIVFCNSTEHENTIHEVLCDELAKFNLYINDQKLQKYTRPFQTDNSDSIVQLKKSIQEFDSYFQSSNTNEPKSTRIRNPGKIKRTLIDQVKSIAKLTNSGYSTVAPYLVSAFVNKVIRICNIAEQNLNPDDEEYEENLTLIRATVSIHMDLCFFFFCVQPSVTNSYRLAKAIVVADQFFTKIDAPNIPNFRSSVMEEINQILKTIPLNSEREGFVPLALINIITATANFGGNYTIDPVTLEESFGGISDASYFELVSLLYYCRDHDRYAQLRIKLEKFILQKLSIDKRFGVNAETAFIFLDCVGCPYVSKITRQKILDLFLNQCEPSKTYSASTKNTFLVAAENKKWFIDWRNLDLLNLLERRELNATY